MKEEMVLPGRWSRFLWWLATTEIEVLKKIPSEWNKFSVMGWTVLGTWIFATLSWIYFFTTVSAWYAALPLGILMGLLILGIDRALIKGIDIEKRQIWPIVFRLVLAATIGLFMSQPALLFLFRKEVQTQMALDIETMRKEKIEEVAKVYTLQKTQLIQEKNQLQNQLQQKYTEVQNARAAYIAETDGTGGSKKIGLKSIALVKQQAYEQVSQDYVQLKALVQPKINQLELALQNISEQENNALMNFDKLDHRGFLLQTTALQNLLDKNTTLQWRYFLLLMLILLIELMPIVTKYLLPQGIYEAQLKWQTALNKQQIQQKYSLAMELEKTAFEHQLNEHQEQMKHYFDAAVESKKEWSNNAWQDWKKNPEASSGLFQKFKTTVLNS